MIKDTTEFIKFQHILPSLAPHERFHVQLVARSKYLPEGKKNIPSTVQLKNTFSRDSYEAFQTISDWSELAPFTTKNGIEIAKESLVVLFSPNPISIKKAAKDLALELLEFTFNEKLNDLNVIKRYHSVMSKAVSKAIFIDLDIDTVGRPKEDILNEIFNILPKEICVPVATIGGAHLLIKKQDIPKSVRKSWYHAISKIPEVTLFSGKNQTVNIPTPGTLQNGVLVKMI